MGDEGDEHGGASDDHVQPPVGEAVLLQDGPGSNQRATGAGVAMPAGPTTPAAAAAPTATAATAACAGGGGAEAAKIDAQLDKVAGDIANLSVLNEINVAGRTQRAKDAGREAPNFKEPR